MDRLDCHECIELERKILDAADDIYDNVVIGTNEGGYVAKLVKLVEARRRHMKVA